MENKMFCYQCQETAGCKGCSVRGVCGKTPEVAALQDLLIYVTKGCAALTTALRSEGKEVSYEVNHRITALAQTLGEGTDKKADRRYLGLQGRTFTAVRGQKGIAGGSPLDGGAVGLYGKGKKCRRFGNAG